MTNIEETCICCGCHYESHSDYEKNPEPGAFGWGGLCPDQPWPGDPGWRDNEGHSRWTTAEDIVKAEDEEDVVHGTCE